jgi:N-dimethylarginine dimethylaminohydrolase
MPPLSLSVRHEYDRLRSVVLGHPETFPLTVSPSEIINDTIRETIERGAMPTREIARQEFAGVRKVLEEFGVEVLHPEVLGDAFNQLFPRDLGFVIGTEFVLARMAKECRRVERKGIQYLLDRMDHFHEIPEGEMVEGGDVVVDGDTVYVGLSERTTAGGVAFLQKRFPDYRVVGVPIKKPEKGSECLHLDCAFVPVGKGCALLFRDAFLLPPEELFGAREYIEVTATEQRALGTNVLCLSPSVVMTRDSATRLNQELTQRGFEVRSVTFNGAPALGGSFRCCTLPLRREG